MNKRQARLRLQTPSLELEISAIRVGQPYVEFLRQHLYDAHRLLNPPLAELSVALVGDTRMSNLHKQFMDIEGPTDVLTFPLEYATRDMALSGEVVICFPEARRQAKARRIPLAHELLLYAVHGMLHLSGFDDQSPSDFREIHAMEDKILDALGLGPVAGNMLKNTASEERPGGA